MGRDGAQGVFVSKAGADFEQSVDFFESFRFSDCPEIDHRVLLVMLFGDPKAETGGARDEAGIGMLVQKAPRDWRFF